MSAPDCPPRLAAWLIGRALPPDTAEPILGDFEELYRLRSLRGGAGDARRWYWRQTLGLIAARLHWRPLGRPTPVRRNTAMSALIQDLRFALRALRKQAGFTLTAVLTLALGIGANIAIFALVYAVLIKPLPFREPEELVLVQMMAPDREAPGVSRPMVWSYPKYAVLRDRQQVFTGTALFTSNESSLTDTAQPERLQGEAVEASYFTVLGVTAQFGRLLRPEEDRVGAAPVVVIGYGLWQRRFGGDPNVLGKTIGLDKSAYTIVGVAPPGFRGLLGQAEIWRSLPTYDAVDLTQPFSHSYYQVARRRPGVSMAQAEAAVRVLGSQVNAAFPDTRNGRQWGARAVALDDERVDPVLRRAAFILLGAAAVVLLIACVNLANLTLARGLSRQREVSIRLALGASRLRIGRQLLTESLVLSVAGTVAGVLVAATSIRVAVVWMPDLRSILQGQQAGLTRVGAGMLGVDGTLVLLTMGLAVVTALLFGLAPAWQAAQANLTSTIKVGSGGSVSSGFRGFTFRNALVVGEIALALVMLTAAGLMLKSLERLGNIDLGFRPDRLVTFRLSLPDGQYAPPQRLQFIEQFLARLNARPEIESAAFGYCAPVQGGCNGTSARFPDRPPVPRGAEASIGVTWASPEYFSTLGVRLIRGRWFTHQDRAGQPRVVVVNERAAQRFWNGEDPIGKRISLGQGGFSDGAEVIGVVGDVRYRAVETPAIPDAYIPVLQSPRNGGVFFVKSRGAAAAVLAIVRQELGALDRDLPPNDVKTMDERYGEATWRTWMIGGLLALFAGLALILALVGIFGVLAQGVAQRTREIGVRMALGAERRDILRLVLGRASVMAGAGVAAGLAGSYFASRLLTTLLYEVVPNDVAVLSGVALLLFAVSLVASYLPARRATRVDPLETLRSE
jgi:predicted permease